MSEKWIITYSDGLGHGIGPSAGREVAHVHGHESRARAEQIVTAVNSHEELLEALKDTEGSLSDLVWFCENGFIAPEELDKDSWDACCAAFRDLLKADYRTVVADARAIIAKTERKEP